MTYLRLGGILAAVLACIGLGWYLGGLSPKKALSDLQAQDWESKYQASQVALSAVQDQLTHAQAISTNNATVIQGLQDENSRINAGWAADRDLAQRLLNSAKTSPGPTVSPTKSGQTTVSAGPAPGDGSITSDLADAAAECSRNAAQLNSLISEITPQL